MPSSDAERPLIVLDTSSELRAFIREVNRTKHDPIVTNMVLDELLDRIHSEYYAADNVNDYATEVMEDKHLSDASTSYMCFDIRPALAPAIKELGEMLLAKVDSLGMYDHTGLLPYGLYAKPEEDDYSKVNNDIILVRQFPEDFIN